MGSANTLEIEPPGNKLVKRSDNNNEQMDSVDNMSKSFNQSALAGVNLSIKTKLNSDNPAIRGSQTSSHAAHSKQMAHVTKNERVASGNIDTIPTNPSSRPQPMTSVADNTKLPLHPSRQLRSGSKITRSVNNKQVKMRQSGV
jgi:hypothetical protein